MTTPPREASPHYVQMLKAWGQREAELVAGRVIPTFQDRLAGHSPFQGSALIDFRQLVDIELDRDQMPDALAVALMNARAVPSASTIWEAAELADSDLRDALVYHAALRGHRPAVAEMLAASLEAYPRHPVRWLQQMALTNGLLLSGDNADAADELEAADAEEARAKGLHKLETLARVLADFALAADAGDSVEAAQAGMEGALAAMKAAQEKKAGEAIEAEHADTIEAMLEDRAEIRRDPELLVVDADPNAKQPSARADMWKAYKGVIGKPLRLVSTSAVPAARTELHARYPHMHAEIDAIFMTQAALRSVKLGVLLVGPPSCGKTTFGREMGERLGLPTMVYSCAGASDGAFGGTSAQWNSARPSTAMQHVGRTATANPLILLDEIDKIGESRQNGSLRDTLLSFLEPVSARAFYDLALEIPVDLSAVSYIATANVLEDVPAALRDRFKIVRIPSPGFEHIGVLSARIIDDLARDRGLDRRWLEPLAQDEEDLVKQAWQGGSLRQLQRIVTMLVDGRETLMGRA